MFKLEFYQNPLWPFNFSILKHGWHLVSLGKTFFIEPSIPRGYKDLVVNRAGEIQPESPFSLDGNHIVTKKMYLRTVHIDSIFTLIPYGAEDSMDYDDQWRIVEECLN